MKIQGISQSYCNSHKKQQSFSALTIAGSRISVEHLFRDGSGSSNKVRKLIEATGCPDQETKRAIFEGIRGLALLDAHTQTVTDIRLGSKPEALLIKMSSGPWDEAELPVDLSFEDIIEAALIRERNVSSGYREKMMSQIDSLTTVTQEAKPGLNELLNIMPPIAQEVGFRFSNVYFALRKALGFK